MLEKLLSALSSMFLIHKTKDLYITRSVRPGYGYEIVAVDYED